MRKIRGGSVKYSVSKGGGALKGQIRRLKYLRGQSRKKQRDKVGSEEMMGAGQRREESSTGIKHPIIFSSRKRGT